MKFEDFYVGMQFKVIREFYLLKVGDVAYVKVKDDEDKSVYVEKLWSHEGHWIGSNFGNYLEAIQEKPCAAQEAIDYIKNYFGSTSEYEAILRKHEKDRNGWDGNLHGLNGLPIDQLRELLFGQNVVQDEPSVPDYEQQTNLQTADYMSLIDAALIIGDKQWFDELVAKTKNEGAIS